MQLLNGVHSADDERLLGSQDQTGGGAGEGQRYSRVRGKRGRGINRVDKGEENETVSC